MVGESACNPSSVEGDHLSRMPVAWHLQRPTRGRGGPPHPPSCSVLLRVGFAKPTSRLAAGELLPHRFSLTCPRAGGLFSVALSLGSPPLGVTQHPALWSSDFPQGFPRDHLVHSGIILYHTNGLFYMAKGSNPASSSTSTFDGIRLRRYSASFGTIICSVPKWPASITTKPWATASNAS